LFFFSSRRRHTRFSRDWSSDVCSSDLIGENRGQSPISRKLGSEPSFRKLGSEPFFKVASARGLPRVTPRSRTSPSAAAARARHRSEERRVGKEGSGRGAQ